MRIEKFLSTLGPIGYLSAPGTMATFFTLPLVVLLQFFLTLKGYLFIVGISIFFSFFVIKRALYFFCKRDPEEIVLDELVGCLITFIALPLHIYSLVLGFALFRFFDIVKCFGIRSCEKFDGVWGVLGDDIVAGFFANMSVHGLLFVFSLVC